MDYGGQLTVKYVCYDAGIVGRTLVSVSFPVKRHLLSVSIGLQAVSAVNAEEHALKQTLRPMHGARQCLPLSPYLDPVEEVLRDYSLVLALMLLAMVLDHAQIEAIV